MNAELRSALRDAGASAEKADAAAIVTPSVEQVPTKTDFAVGIAPIRGELRAMRMGFILLLAGLALVIVLLYQRHTAISENTAVLRQIQISAEKNAVSIEQNRLAIEENTR